MYSMQVAGFRWRSQQMLASEPPQSEQSPTGVGWHHDRKPGKCGAGSAAWFCRRRLSLLDTRDLAPSTKAAALLMDGETRRNQGVWFGFLAW